MDNKIFNSTIKPICKDTTIITLSVAIGGSFIHRVIEPFPTSSISLIGGASGALSSFINQAFLKGEEHSFKSSALKVLIYVMTSFTVMNIATVFKFTACPINPLILFTLTFTSIFKELITFNIGKISLYRPNASFPSTNQPSLEQYSALSTEYTVIPGNATIPFQQQSHSSSSYQQSTSITIPPTSPPPKAPPEEQVLAEGQQQSLPPILSLPSTSGQNPPPFNPALINGQQSHSSSSYQQSTSITIPPTSPPPKAPPEEQVLAEGQQQSLPPISSTSGQNPPAFNPALINGQPTFDPNISQIEEDNDNPTLQTSLIPLDLPNQEIFKLPPSLTEAIFHLESQLGGDKSRWENKLELLQEKFNKNPISWDNLSFQKQFAYYICAQKIGMEGFPLFTQFPETQKEFEVLKENPVIFKNTVQSYYNRFDQTTLRTKNVLYLLNLFFEYGYPPTPVMVKAFKKEMMTLDFDFDPLSLEIKGNYSEAQLQWFAEYAIKFKEAWIKTPLALQCSLQKKSSHFPFLTLPYNLDDISNLPENIVIHLYTSFNPKILNSKGRYFIGRLFNGNNTPTDYQYPELLQMAPSERPPIIQAYINQFIKYNLSYDEKFSPYLKQELPIFFQIDPQDLKDNQFSWAIAKYQKHGWDIPLFHQYLLRQRDGARLANDSSSKFPLCTFTIDKQNRDKKIKNDEIPPQKTYFGLLAIRLFDKEAFESFNPAPEDFDSEEWAQLSLYEQYQLRMEQGQDQYEIEVEKPYDNGTVKETVKEASYYPSYTAQKEALERGLLEIIKANDCEAMAYFCNHTDLLTSKNWIKLSREVQNQLSLYLQANQLEKHSLPLHPTSALEVQSLGHNHNSHLYYYLQKFDPRIFRDNPKKRRAEILAEFAEIYREKALTDPSFFKLFKNSIQENQFHDPIMLEWARHFYIRNQEAWKALPFEEQIDLQDGVLYFSEGKDAIWFYGKSSLYHEPSLEEIKNYSDQTIEKTYCAIGWDWYLFSLKSQEAFNDRFNTCSKDGPYVPYPTHSFAATLNLEEKIKKEDESIISAYHDAYIDNNGDRWDRLLPTYELQKAWNQAFAKIGLETLKITKQPSTVLKV